MDDGGLRGRVVGVTRLTEDARRRADKDERAVAPLGDAAEEAAGGQKARGQIRVEGLAPASEGQLPDRHVLARPDACDSGADVDRSGRRKQLVDLGLVRQVGAGDGSAAELVRERLRPVTAAVVMDDDLSALGSKRTRA